jgi:hypothetical protein
MIAEEAPPAAFGVALSWPPRVPPSGARIGAPLAEAVESASSRTERPMSRLEGAASCPRTNSAEAGRAPALAAGFTAAKVPVKVGATSGFEIGLISLPFTWTRIGLVGRTGSPFPSELGGTAVRQPAAVSVHGEAPFAPTGVQPIQPGPEYQFTSAGLQAPSDPGTQNQPKPGLKFQKP